MKNQSKKDFKKRLVNLSEENQYSRERYRNLSEEEKIKKDSIVVNAIKLFLKMKNKG